MANTSPYQDKQHGYAPAIAAGTDQDSIIAVIDRAGTVTGITLTFAGAITAADATARTFTAYNRGTAGVGTTVVATLVTNVAQGNILNGDEVSMTLSGTAANLVVAAGDVIEIVETHATTGTAHSGWRSKVVVRPDC